MPRGGVDADRIDDEEECKTTLARSLDCSSFDLEQPGGRTRRDVECERVRAQGALVVLDEAQSWRALFS
jgi:hypothetical protein